MSGEYLPLIGSLVFLEQVHMPDLTIRPYIAGRVKTETERVVPRKSVIDFGVLQGFSFDPEIWKEDQLFSALPMERTPSLKSQGFCSILLITGSAAAVVSMRYPRSRDSRQS